MISPWERQPKESAQAWAAFVAYRDIGPYRSTAQAAQKLSRSKRVFDEHSREYNWVARAAAWDAECDRVRRQAILQQQRDVVKEHAEAAAIIRKHAMKTIKAIGSDIDADQAIKWMQIAVKIEQTAIGIPTDRATVDVNNRQNADPMTVFFDTLPPKQLISIAREAMHVAETTTGSTADECSSATTPAKSQ